MSTQEFDALVSRFSGVMATAIRRVCGRRHRALIQDVEQEVHLALWKRLQSGKKIDHPVSYLYKVALTTALAVLQKQAPQEIPVDMQALESRTPQPRSGLEPPERTRLLAQMLQRLPADQSRALKAYLAGFNHKEVAALYGWSESVARHRIYRGMNVLKSIAQGASDDV